VLVTLLTKLGYKIGSVAQKHPA